MINSLQRITIVSIFILILINSKSFGQEFNTSPLITIPGDNIEFAVITSEMGFRNCESYICWINKLDSVYTVFLKQLSPIVGEAIVVASDIHFKSNPQITYGTIGWQSMHDSLWQVTIRNYNSDQLAPPVVILDSLEIEPDFSLSNYRIVWIQNKKLLTKIYYPDEGTTILVDSTICSSPIVGKWDGVSYTEILYEKIINSQQRISKAVFYDYPTPKWTYSLLEGDSARNPNYGISGGVSFEILENNVSRIQYSAYDSDWFISTTNEACNYRNPSVLSYAVTTGSTSGFTPFFVIFDSDSIPGNNEIFLKPFHWFQYGDTVINISQLDGNDREPQLLYLTANDSIYVAVLWKHTQDAKTDIWMAKTHFNPYNDEIKNRSNQVSLFRLSQNYPNPFNPSTIIEYQIPNVGTQNFVSLRIYDLLGREVATLVNEQKPAGIYSLQWNADGLSSGIYFCQLQTGVFTKTKKLILLR